MGMSGEPGGRLDGERIHAAVDRAVGEAVGRSAPTPSAHPPSARSIRRAASAEVGAAGGPAPEDVSRSIIASAGRGRPFEGPLRTRIERSAGVDLSRISVHENSALAPRIQARAFTVGNDIHFAPGEYDPTSAAGTRLIAHEIGHVMQQSDAAPSVGRMIRRAPLTSAAVIAVVDALDPKLKGHLDEAMAGEDKTSTTAETMRVHVTKAVDVYLQNNVGDDVRDNAVTLSIVLDGIAGVVSEALYDPWIRPKLATRLLDLYKADLNKGLAGTATTTAAKDDARHTTALAGVLLTNDPIGLYMHGELREAEAVRRIVLMSKNAKGALNDFDPTGTAVMTATDMFTMLRKRFEAQMLAYTQSAVMRREHLGRDNGSVKTTATRNADNSVDASQATAYSTRESTDNVSVRYFNSLFGANTDPTAITDFTATAKKKLDDLGTAVSTSTAAWGPSPSLAPRDPSVTPGQEQVLQDIEAKDNAINRPNVIAALEQYAVTTFGFTATKAAAAVAAVVKRLDEFPVTLTMPGSAMFEAGVPKGADTEYKAATVQQRMATTTDQFGRGDDDVIPHVGAYDNPLFSDDRGDKYLQFRIWKDRMMSGNRGLSPEEMPKYGALNVDFETNWASSSQIAPGTNRTVIDGMTETQLRQKKFADMTLPQKKERVAVRKAVGENYYGDLHMVLKDSVRQQNRIVFTCTDHGAPHRDVLYAVHDALGGDFITNLKSGEQSKVLLAVFNESAQQPLNRLTSMLMLEAQIYGRLDVAKDVAKIVVAPYVHPAVKKNAKAFCKKHKITYVEIAPDDPSIANAVQADLKPSDITGLQY